MRNRKIMRRLPVTCGIVSFAALTSLGGCFLLPGGSVVDAALVTHTAGSSQHTAAVKVPVKPEAVYAAMIRIITAEDSGVEIISRNDKAFMVEVDRDGARLTGQVTKLDARQSLLYVWADAGLSDQTGRSQAITSIERICDELGVDYEEVSY
jgi:hypothetical protein